MKKWIVWMGAICLVAVLLLFSGCGQEEDPYRVQIRMLEDKAYAAAGANYPCTWYSGECKDGVLELQRVFVGESEVDVEVKSFSVNHDTDTHFGSEGSVTVRLLSKEDQKAKIMVKGYQSDDNGASIESEVLELKAGKAVDLTFAFAGWRRFPYYVSIEVTLDGADQWDSRTQIKVHTLANKP